MTFTPTPDRPPLQAILWRHAGDPWRVAVATMLLNFTGRRAVDLVWPALFGQWPDAARMAVARRDLDLLLAPLGFGRQRPARLRAMSAAWTVAHDRRLAHDFAAARSCPLDVTHLPGLGTYSQDSHDLFVRGRVDWILDRAAGRKVDPVVLAWAHLADTRALALDTITRAWTTPAWRDAHDHPLTV